jgi:hypothetical protein
MFCAMLTKLYYITNLKKCLQVGFRTFYRASESSPFNRSPWPGRQSCSALMHSSKNALRKKKEKKKFVILKKYSRKIANFQNRFFRILFFAKPIATPPESPHKILAKSVKPSRRGGGPKSGQTDRQDLRCTAGRIFHLPTSTFSLREKVG